VQRSARRPCRHRRELHAGLGVQLVQQRGNVGLDGVGRDEERLGDGLVRTSFGHQCEDLSLPWTEDFGGDRRLVDLRRCDDLGARLGQDGERFIQNLGNSQCMLGGYCRRNGNFLQRDARFQRRLRERSAVKWN
jgi:hypothetical protein